MIHSRPSSRSFRSILLGALLLSLGALAANTVDLSGTVASTATVAAVATSGAGTLDMGGLGSSIGEQIVKVADLTMNTNNSSGVTLTITKSGDLTNGTDNVTFQALAVADNATPLTGEFTSPVTFTTSADGEVLSDLWIAYNPAAVLDPGTYTATITVTVADK